MSRESRLVIIEEYVISGVRRYKVKDEKTGLTINVAAESPEEALEKSINILGKVASH